MGLVIAILGGAAVMGILWMVLRPRGTAGSGWASTRIGADGFFVSPSGSNFPEGAQVEYECLVNGTWRRGMAGVSGSETFVYTGTPPTEVRILGVSGVSGVSDIAAISSVTSVSPPISSDDEPFAGVPNTY